ncbi:GerAB/ArcD/ProY family transporter [Paenibacillus physcomitrellae]|uniref:Germination protein n=1 Tax=Paenibacillus physcomitrellae TaxID=1619311 RepID=A0ABQ1FSB5_9BACL|nr:endospore germination permease [Paenibacillus physcomitrellae]GGA29110.1 germination protein [Paenibacillus physcomitrellae]
MINQNQIFPRQFFVLTFGLVVGTSILVTPSGLAHTAREDAWMASLVSLSINVLTVLLYIGITRLYPGRTIFQIHEDVLGKALGKLLNLLYLFYFLILTGTLLGNLGFFLSSEMMPETPIEAIQIIFLVAAIVCAHKGIIILARVSELMFPWIILLFLILVGALIPQIHWNYIKPVLEDGWIPVFKAGIHSSMFEEMIVMLTFISMVNEKKSRERLYVMGTITGGLVLSIIVLLSVLVLGIEQTENSTFPAFALAKTINVGNFFQRVEGILITIWILTFFIKISLLFLSMLHGLQVTFGLKDHKPFIYPLAILFVIVAWNTYTNTVYVANIIQSVWVGYATLHLAAIPMIIWLIGWVRRKVSHSS